MANPFDTFDIEPTGSVTVSAPSAPQELTAGRVGELMTRGAAPVVTGALAGQAIAGAPGALIGSMALPIGDVINQLVNLAASGVEKITGAELGRLGMPSQIASQAMANIGLAEPSSTAERIIEGSTGALTSTSAQLPKLAQIAKEAEGMVSRGVAEQMAQAPRAQLAATVPAQAAGQIATEVTGSPLAGMIASMGAGAPFGVSVARKPTVTKEQMTSRIADEYSKVNKSGILIKTDAFNQNMDEITKDLRQQGFSPTNPRFSGISNMIEEITTNTMPKDVVELKAIRNQITASADPKDADAYRLMKVVRDKFDDYLLNLPEDQLIKGQKGGLDAWKSARNLFAKEKKAEIFDDILTNAPISKGAFSQSGMENYLYNELKKIARNKNTMAIFNKSEQEAIRKAAEGSGLQNALKFIGRFAPTGNIPLLSTLGVGYFDPFVAAAMGATTLAARTGAEQMRIGDVNRLVNMMRTGQLQPSQLRNVPTTSVRGLLTGTVEEPVNPFEMQ